MRGIKDTIYLDSEEEKKRTEELVKGRFHEAEIKDASDALFLFAISVTITGYEIQGYEKFLAENDLTNKSLTMLSE